MTKKGNYLYIILTKKGNIEAQGAIRRHRLAEKLLINVLGMKTEDVEDAACGFEHHIDEKVEEKLCTLLNHPKKCPHGKSIPMGKCCKRKGIKSKTS